MNRALSIVVALLAAGALALIAAFWLRGTDIETIEETALVERPSEEPTLLLSGHSGEGEQRRFGWTEMELASGRILARTWFPPEAGEVSVRTIGGSSVLYRDAAGEHIRELTSGMEIDAAGIASRWPLLAPWSHSAVIAPGELALTAPDGSHWVLQIADGAARPSPTPPPAADLRCDRPHWMQEGGRALVFLPTGSGLHALVQATPDEAGGYTDPKPLGVEMSHGAFLCDERTGRVARFRDGAAIVSLWTDDMPPLVEIAKIRADGRIAWGYVAAVEASDEVDIELFGMGHSVVVRVADAVLRLRADGVAEWKRAL